VIVRHGKGDKRVRHQRTQPGADVGRDRRTVAASRVRRTRRRASPFRPASAAPRARDRARPRGRAVERHPAPVRTRRPRRDVRLSPGIDTSEIVNTLFARQPPTMSATAGLLM
jgi:hypothetical protein